MRVQFYSQTHIPTHIPLLSGANGPDAVRDRLIAEVQVPIVQVHEPRAARKDRRRGGRPVRRILHIRERMPRRQRGAEVGVINQALQFAHVRQPPVRLVAAPVARVPRRIPIHRPARIQLCNIAERLRPGPRGIGNISILQPDQPRQVIRHRPVTMIREPRIRPRRPQLQIAVICCRETVRQIGRAHV